MTTQQSIDGTPWVAKQSKHLWFHVASQPVQDGVIAKIGVTPWAVYCAIKSHVGLETGNAWPSNARIGEIIGVSVDTVQRSMKMLAEAGLIVVDKKQRGNSNRYSIKESIKVDEMDGTPWAVGERKYVPVGFAEFTQQMQRLAESGNWPTDKAIQINITVVQGDNNTVNSYNVDSPL